MGSSWAVHEVAMGGVVWEIGGVGAGRNIVCSTVVAVQLSDAVDMHMYIRASKLPETLNCLPCGKSASTPTTCAARACSMPSSSFDVCRPHAVARD